LPALKLEEVNALFLLSLDTEYKYREPLFISATSWTSLWGCSPLC